MQTILVDIFDTLLFRLCSPETIQNQWARCMVRKHPHIKIGAARLAELRREVFLDLRKNGGEPSYHEAMGLVYCQAGLDCSISLEEFCQSSHGIDFALECGCNVKNKRLIKWLLKQKMRGATIAAVSDFYLGKEDMEKLFFLYGIPLSIFDELFVSVDHGCRKANGRLYSKVLNELSVQGSDVMMIGDSYTSDIRSARLHGIKASYRPRLFRKARRLRQPDVRLLRKMTKIDYRAQIPFLEYGLLYSVFCKRLYTEIVRKQVHRLAFMAREGYFLRELFRAYEELIVPDEAAIEDLYYHCSRRSALAGSFDDQLAAIMGEPISISNWLKSVGMTVDTVSSYISEIDADFEAPMDLSQSEVYQKLMSDDRFISAFRNRVAENRELFCDYTREYLDGGILHFVDSGWRGTTQNALETRYGFKTVGFYIGVRLPETHISGLDMKGLIFDERTPQSKRFGYLGSNIPFYQQLLAAPHGTTVHYKRNDHGAVEPVQEWDPIEENLYSTAIKPHQDAMRLRFRGYCAWDMLEAYDDKQDQAMAKAIFRANLFLFGERFDFARRCVKGYVQNFKQEKRGNLKYDYTRAKIHVDVVWNPANYIRYFTKIQRSELYSNPLVRTVYPIAAHAYYAYVLLVDGIKEFVFKDGIA